MRAIFLREFNWKRPKSKFSFNVQPSPKPRLLPHDVIEAAIAAGAAIAAAPKAKPSKPEKAK